MLLDGCFGSGLGPGPGSRAAVFFAGGIFVSCVCVIVYYQCTICVCAIEWGGVGMGTQPPFAVSQSVRGVCSK